MYDDSSITDTESLSTSTSVASILGIKGGLRIRHHTASQKAHVVLRRVESSESDSEDGEENNVVSFKLFANKQISLKPGKELLLTIASVDGRFKDQVVMFEGNLRGSDEDSDHEGTTQVEEEPQVIEEEEEIIPQAAMPPKMRRQWTKKVEEVSPVIFRIPVAHSSVGVQAQPLYTSSSVQAIAVQNSVSIQVQPSQNVASVQTYSSHTSSAVQVDPPPLPSYTSLDVQTDPILPSVELNNIPQPFPRRFEHASSLSPMQLDSPGAPSTIIPPLSVQIPGSREPSEDMEMSPAELKVEDIEETIPISSLQTRDIVQEEVIRPPVLTHPPLRPRPVTDMFDLEDSPETSWISSPRISKPPPQRNSFVSGGFVTDFIGAVTLPVKEALQETPFVQIDSVLATNSSATDPPLPPPESDNRPPQKAQSGSHRRRAAKRARLRVETRAGSAAAANSSPIGDGVSAVAVSHRSGGGWEEPIATPQPLALLIPAPCARAPTQNSIASSSKSVSADPSPFQNAVASSSKSVFSVPLPTHPLHAGTSILPRAVTRAKEKAPITAEKQQQHGYIDLTSSPPSTPPPEPKAVARIPAGPSSNPLNIRPSNSVFPSTLTRPPTSAVAAPKVKKRVVVGRGWPFVRASTASGAPAGSQLAAASKSGLSNSSPSHPANGPISKWKRIDSEISIGVPPADDAPVDMVLSDPPSPAGRSSLSSPAGASVPIPVPPKDLSLSLDTPPTTLDRINCDTNTFRVRVQSTRLENGEARTADLSLPGISPDTTEGNPPEPPAVANQSKELEKKLEKQKREAPAATPTISLTEPPAEAANPPARLARNTSATAQVNPVNSASNAITNISLNTASLKQQPTQFSAFPPASSTGTSTTSSNAIPVFITDDASKLTQRKSSQQKRVVQLPTHHPLPAKPPPSVVQNSLSFSAPRGVKRERPPSPDLWTAPGIVRVQLRRKRRWPTVEWTHQQILEGDGDLGIRHIAFNSDGSCFALNCRDQTLRIWSSKTRLEIACLSHNSQVICLAWLDGDAAVLSLGEDGVLGKWTRIGQQNQWQWGRVIDNVGAERYAPEDTVCLACARDRIAVAFPKSGVKVWIWCKGSWLAQRSIMRTNVTALKFIDGGDALLGGTREGVVWHCAVPNGTMKVYAFLQSSITSIGINPTGMQALIAQAGGSACLVSLGLQDEKRVGQSYLETDLRDGSLGAIFTTQGKTVVFGAVDGCLLVWDAQKGGILYGMEHEDGDFIQTVARCNSPQGGVIAGTRQGRLLWWPEPQAPGPSNASRKRPKVK